VRAAIVATVVLVLAAIVAFFKPNPFASSYEIRGAFSSANQLKAGSEVRIAGVQVGQVSAIDPGRHNTSIVTMQIDDSGRPVHADATLSIEPRLLLEGNFYVNLAPGSPEAPELRDGATIALQSTSVPVQLGQVLDTFDLPTRGALQRSIAALASGLGTDRQLHQTSGAAGYTGLRSAVRELDGALASVAQVSHAARGTQPGDLERAIPSSANFTAQLARDPSALADMVTNFNRFTGALADEDHALAASLQGLDTVLRVAPASLTALDSALPALTNFGGALRPALRVAPGPLHAEAGLLSQLQGLVRPRELPALLDDLKPVTTTLPDLERRLGRLLPLVTHANECLSTHVVWTLDQTLKDGSNSTGDPAYLDLVHAFTGATSISGGFDGNGVAIRSGIASGASSISGLIPGLGYVAGGGPQIQGVRPTWLGYGVEPPYRPDQWCYRQQLPDLSARSGPPPNFPSHGDTVSMGPIR
jgi:virulence factor Mce-like protein